MTEYSEQTDQSFSDVLISMLTAITAGGVVWAAGVGVVAGINYAGEYFQIGPPAAVWLADVIQIAYVAGPILAGILAAWRAYIFTIQLD